jgi:hypothetical protein
LVSDWVRSASGAALEEVCRGDLLGEGGGELIVAVARRGTALPKTATQAGVQSVR